MKHWELLIDARTNRLTYYLIIFEEGVLHLMLSITVCK